MNNIKAIFMKQMRSMVKMPTFIGMAIAFLVMGLLIAVVSDGGHLSEITGSFVPFIVGMQLIIATTGLITEDKTTMNLRFLSMAGMTPRQYLLGTWAAVFAVAASVMTVYALVGGFWGMSTLWFIAVTWAGSAVSILLGITLGLSKNPEISTPIGVFLGLAPMFSQANEALESTFRIAFSQQMRLAVEYISVTTPDENLCDICEEIIICCPPEAYDIYETAVGVLQEAFVITAANGVVVLALFIWMHRKYGLTAEPKE